MIFRYDTLIFATDIFVLLFFFFHYAIDAVAFSSDYFDADEVAAAAAYMPP